MQTTRTGTGPVLDAYLADPFAFHDGSRYFVTGTGPHEALGTQARGRSIFPLYTSPDLREWEPSGHALVRPDLNQGDAFWAPAVAEHQGVFYLYYSVGLGDTQHHLRVATSARPGGPYRDAGVELTKLSSCPFAIDPHPFCDAGRWYMFYATDFLNDHDAHGNLVRPGTALVVQELDSMIRLVPPVTTILRARHDWQRFQADRSMYGRRYDWHTLEGPCVVARGGRYYCFYSGGRWDTHRYGIDFAVAPNVLGPYDASGSESGPRVLWSSEGRRGPGHNSLVVGPDGVTDHIVYHAWSSDLTKRQLHIDALEWTEEGPRVISPTFPLRSEPAPD